jgi:hypothetical protein
MQGQAYRVIRVALAGLFISGSLLLTLVYTFSTYVAGKAVKEVRAGLVLPETWARKEVGEVTAQIVPATRVEPVPEPTAPTEVVAVRAGLAESEGLVARVVRAARSLWIIRRIST